MRADQLAGPVLSFVEGLKQGQPADESVPLLASRQASDKGRRMFTRIRPSEKGPAI
ncbi:hypothetical protein [Candidatus Nitrospira neomarina]|uniref:Uncharacterized protein n=1 Tax=Candidatus Nitrospira neomarina TaxID=3020899 RepID=A0AA96GKN4_9BACT|nr:hypothetical protein [Candidatus Nitrospira neomarina]WNM63696.1 hypothetical protein PQG83_08060 [Candidatus Nitrospira neomarina]